MNAMNTVLDDADAKLRSVVREINKTNGQAPERVNEVQPFVELSVKLADSLVEVYSQILTEVDNKLQEAKLDAKRIREIANKRAADVADLRKRLEGFSETMLGAHRSYFQPQVEPQEETKNAR